MENVTLRAHFDGERIVIDEPSYSLEEGARLLITVLPGTISRKPWARARPEEEGPEPLEGGGAPPPARQRKPRKTTGGPVRARQHGTGDGNAPVLARQPDRASGGTGEPAGDYVVFNRVAIRDPDVNNIEGATLLLPEGWTLDGRFVWMPLFSMQAYLYLRASDPATGATCETLPAQWYVWLAQMVEPLPIGTNYLGRVLLPPPGNPVEFVYNTYVSGPLQHLRSARLERVDDMPELAAASAREQGAGVNVRVTRLGYAYESGGRGWEEEVYLTLTFLPFDGLIQMWAGSAVTLRAPAGEMERLRPLLLVPLQSARVTLDWSATLEQVRQMYHQGLARQMHNQRQLGRMMQEHREELRRAHQQTYEERMASQDRLSFARREALGGIETYVNPYDSHAVEIPVGYNYHWASDDGMTIISTNDPNRDPRPGDRRNWQLMERYRP